MILRSAKSPPEPFPTHRPTNPFVRSLSWVTTRLGCFASPTKTLTLGLATTTRTWSQALGSGAGLTGCSKTPGRSVLNFCHVYVGCDIDRKSTRLNSSHLVISYAVFCLKKKKESRRRPHHDVQLV